MQSVKNIGVRYICTRDTSCNVVIIGRGLLGQVVRNGIADQYYETY